MFYYVIRSKLDGQYLVANIVKNEHLAKEQYILVFNEDFEALSYLNAHAPQFTGHFVVECLGESQLKTILQRWGYIGLGYVQEPLQPTIHFLRS